MCDLYFGDRLKQLEGAIQSGTIERTGLVGDNGGDDGDNGRSRKKKR